MREAPSLRIIDDLLKAGVKVRVYDPAAMESARRLLPDIIYCEDEYEAAAAAMDLSWLPNGTISSLIWTASIERCASPIS
jgi:UDP-glucose 6-dehydrogenase